MNYKVYHRNAYWFIFQIRVRLRKLTQMSACEQVLIGAYIASLSVAVRFRFTLRGRVRLYVAYHISRGPQTRRPLRSCAASMGTFLQAEALKFVPRLSVTRDNENILRRATFKELKFNATKVKIMRPFIDIYKIVILVAGCFLRLLLYYIIFSSHLSLQAGPTMNMTTMIRAAE